MDLGYQLIHCLTFIKHMKEEIRKKLKVIVLVILILFLGIYSVVMFIQFSSTKNISGLSDTGIVLAGNKLTIFGKQELIDGYPDRVALHYPYFLVIKAEKRITEVYNVQNQKIVKTYSQPILDYFNGQVVYNGNGYHTYLNGKDLGIFCDQAFIVSNLEVLCVTRPDFNSLNNILVSINPKTHSKHTVYTPQNVITATYEEKSTLYIAEYDYTARKGYVEVSGERISIAYLINTFYEMDGKAYAVSFMSVWNNNIESYGLVSTQNGKLIVRQIEREKIVFNK